ncbi:MAG: preprotein translocase subunit SecA [Myxococcales bacterium]|nr:preprotein translocase subunit SecA [Myxococcales bacterium]MCB9541907.1 preprotein translocase subunit SecA [Myxococcales bacterium]
MLTRIFGSSNDRAVKKLRPEVARVSALEDRFKKLSDDALRSATADFRQQLDNGAKLDDIKFEAFAVAREAAWRVLGMRPYDVQVLGGFVLHSGRIAEMKTGEGKTLVATLPCYLNALSGKGVHVVTVNDYLARRDAEWMGQLYRWLGLSTGVIVNGLSDTERQVAYRSDITYGQNNEFGFDYLRDNMKFDLARYVQRELNFAIIDEVDSILIDEARTPLIISGPAEHQPEMYLVVDRLIPKLKKDIHYNVDEKSHAATLTEEGVEEMQRLLDVDNLYDPAHIVTLHHVNNALKAHTLYRRDVNYLVADGEVVIIDEHTGRLMPGRRWSDGLHQAVEAKERVDIRAENHTLATISFQNYFRLYSKLSGMTGTAKTEEEEFQKIYNLDVVVVPTNKPVIRDDLADMVYRSERGKFRACVADIKAAHEVGQPVLVGTTSVEKSEIIHRMLKSEGVPHKVLNAKHHAHEAAIVAQAGRLGAVTVATNMAGRGTDIILGGNAEYWGQSLLQEMGVAERHTVEWEKVEDFVKQIVIGKPDEARKLRDESPVLAEVGDDVIKRIGETRDLFKSEQKQVLEVGGLFILGTERHESRRIDNQLRGRAGRQGDPGKSRFYLSLEDDLMRIFANDRVTAIMDSLGMSDDAPIEAGMVSRAIENAQRRVEAQHFDSRKNLLEYDDVMNQQRKTIYGWRLEVLRADDATLTEMCLDAIEDLCRDMVDTYCDARHKPEQWDVAGLIERARFQFDVDIDLSHLPQSRERYLEHLYFAAEGPFRAKVADIEGKQAGLMHRIEKDLFLRHIDQHWKDHLTTMDQLRTGIGLRGYGQRDPKKEYQKEGFRLFAALMIDIRSKVMGQLYRLEVRSQEEVAAEEAAYRRRIEAQQRQMQMISATADKTEDGAPAATPPSPAPDDVLARAPRRAPTVRRERPKIGRNDPCWCGSGKKYKKCHMAADGVSDGPDAAV